MVEIKGIEKFAPRDFPGHISSTVFLGGCNLRCPYCHNADLVLRPQTLPAFPLDYFVDFMKVRKDWLEGICVTGGEPLIHEDIAEFFRVIKKQNLLIKLDTNGTFSERLEFLIDSKLIDAVAMDVKAPWSKYSEATGVKADIQEIQKSIIVLREAEIESVFRTTVIPGLVEAKEIEEIGKMLNGAKIFQIQPFDPNNTLDERYSEKKPFSREELLNFARIVEPFFQEVRLEGGFK